jgi:hypothetical protein
MAGSIRPKTEGLGCHERGGHCQINGHICRTGLWSGIQRSIRGYFMATHGTSEHQRPSRYLPSGRGFVAHQLT